MVTRLPPLSSLRAFEAAARLRSFKKAAEELAVTATAISHRIRVLEECLDRPLFVRKVRAVDLTADGQVLLAAVSSGFQTIATAIEHVCCCRRSGRQREARRHASGCSRARPRGAKGSTGSRQGQYRAPGSAARRAWLPVCAHGRCSPRGGYRSPKSPFPWDAGP